jgi:hypothetical protein
MPHIKLDLDKVAHMVTVPDFVPFYRYNLIKWHKFQQTFYCILQSGKRLFHSIKSFQGESCGQEVAYLLSVANLS